MDWFQIEEGVCQGCIFSPCLFNLHVEYIMRNAGLDEAQPGIKFARRNINNVRYADDMTLIQFTSVAQSFMTPCAPWAAACQASLSTTNSWSLHKLMPIKSVMPFNHLILCCPLLLLPSIFSGIRVFSNESALHIRWPKYWSFNLSISPSNEYSRLISFKVDWLDLLAVQRTLKSLLQHHSSKASVLWCSAFFIVQLSHSYVTLGKTIALTKRTFVGKSNVSAF